MVLTEVPEGTGWGQSAHKAGDQGRKRERLPVPAARRVGTRSGREEDGPGGSGNRRENADKRLRRPGGRGEPGPRRERGAPECLEADGRTRRRA